MTKHLTLLAIAILPTIRAPLAFGQENWDWRDPLDLGPVDFGSKYLLAYNAAGLVVALLASRGEKPSAVPHTLSFYSEYHQEYQDPPLSDVFMGKSRIEYALRDWVSFGGEAQMYKMKGALVSTAGLGSALFFTWTPVQGHRWRLYFDNGAGILWTARHFPDGGSRFNFSTFYGLGFERAVSGETVLLIGVRNMHISNAFLFGEDRNPAFDSIGFLVGFRFDRWFSSNE